MKNHHEVGHFKNRMMIGLLSLSIFIVFAGQSFAATTCSTCHGMPPLDSADGSRIPSTGAFKGSHQKHVSGSSAEASACVDCHSGAAGYLMSHSATTGKNVIKITDGIYSKGAFFNQTSVPVSPLGTCSNVCHADVYSAATLTSPAWGAPGNGCSTCHSIPIGVNGPNTGSHTAHAGKACDTCHAAGTTETNAPSVGNGHTNGYVDIFFFNYTTGGLKHAANSGYKSCSTASCHSNGRGQYTRVTWGSESTGCNFCHPVLSGKHSAHTNLASAVYGSTADNSTAASYDFGCGNCHPTVAIGNHLNNTIDVTLNNTHGGVLKSKNNVANDTTGYTRTPGLSVTCAAAYCHSNGMASPTYYGANSNWYTDLYSGDKCARCHGNSPNTGADDAYRVGSNAHNAHVIGIHVDDIFNGVSRKLPNGGGESVNAAHGRNNRSTTINCNICHALTVSTSTNDQNSNCIGCHKSGGSAVPKGDAAIADKSKHVNGLVDISFINSKIATKAQLTGSAFAGYTAANAGGWSRNSNGMPFKTYTSSYDVSKTTLLSSASWTQGINGGCANVACHNGKSVKWTDTISCQHCHTRLK